MTRLSSQKGVDFNAGDAIHQFTIIKLIAKGGMGNVYLAYDNHLKRNVALKTIRSSVLHNDTVKLRFRREAQTLSKINHPSICQIYEYIQGDDSDILVLEFLEGKTLKNIQLKDTEYLGVFIQIASALVVAHEKGIIHRDLKPDNIMLTNDGRVKILDFGIAKSLGIQQERIQDLPLETKEQVIKDAEITEVGTLMGTLYYMSPEQISYKELSNKSDVYSFAIIIHEILTKKKAYDLSSQDRLIQQIKFVQLQNNEEIPADYKDLIVLMTQREAVNRITASETQEQLIKIKDLPQKKKRLKRNLIFGLLMVFLGVVTLYQWNNSIKLNRKSAFELSFKNDLSELSSYYERIYSLPIHNISEDLENIQSKKNQLLQVIKNSSVIFDEDKDLYQGKIYYRAKEYESALPFLKKAWNSGIRNKELAAELAFVNLILYYQKSKDHHYQEGYIDAEFEKELVENYRKPAQLFLKQSNITDQDSSIPQALLLWINNDFEGALSVLKQITSEQDWDFEAYQLQGEIIRSLGNAYYEKGEIQKSMDYVEQAQKVFKEAQIRGRSYAKAYSEVCNMDLTLLKDALNRTGKNFEERYASGIKNCNDALTILPNNNAVFLNLCFLDIAYGFIQVKQGKNPLEYFNRALKISDNVIPAYRSYSTKGEAYTYIAQYKNNQGINPLADYENAIKYHELSLSSKNTSIDKNYTNLMYVYYDKMEYEISIGINPSDSLQLMLTLFKKSEQSKESTKGDKLIRNLLIAEGYRYRAKYQYLVGENPQQSVKTAEEYILTGQSFTDEDPYGDANLAESYSVLIKYKLDHQIIPTSELDKALKSIDRALAKFPNNSGFNEVKATLLTQQQRAFVLENPSSQFEVDTIAKVFDTAIKINPNSAPTYDRLAQMYYYQASLSGDKKVKQQAIELGIDATDKAVKTNKKYSFAYFTKAKLIQLGIKSTVLKKSMQSKIDELMQKAQQINPLLKIVVNE